jgi:MraZ protein
MDMFRGINPINLDAKGRMAMPTRYREHITDHSGGKMVVTIDTESKCLLLYTQPEWVVIETKLQDLPAFNPKTRRIQRLLIGHASDLELDGNGRVLLPATLRDYAGLGKNIVLLGQGKKFEIWSEEEWVQTRDAYLQESEETAIPEELQSLSL